MNMTVEDSVFNYTDVSKNEELPGAMAKFHPATLSALLPSCDDPKGAIGPNHKFTASRTVNHEGIHPETKGNDRLYGTPLPISGYHFDNADNPTIKSPKPLSVSQYEVPQVVGSNIVVHGQPILLRGTCLGVWMVMENFLTGYPGHEHEMSSGLLEVFGKEKYEFYFDKFLEYFFTEADVIAIKDLGFNAVRLGINYRHFEDDNR